MIELVDKDTDTFLQHKVVKEIDFEIIVEKEVQIKLEGDEEAQYKVYLVEGVKLDISNELSNHVSKEIHTPEETTQEIEEGVESTKEDEQHSFPAPNTLKDTTPP